MRIVKLFTIVFLVIFAASCSKNPDPSKPFLSCVVLDCGSSDGKERSDDVKHVNDLIRAALAGPTDNLHFVSQFNFNCNDESLEYICGTSRFRLAKRDSTVELIDTGKINYVGCSNAEDSAKVLFKECNSKLSELVSKGIYSVTQVKGTLKVPLYEPSNLAALIDDAVGKYNADHVLLCISGRGGGWRAEDDGMPFTKAVAWDENFKDDKTGKAIPVSAKNLVAGINASKNRTKVKGLVMNTGQMNFMENICEYADSHLQFVLSSFQTGKGVNYSVMMQYLAQAPNNSDESFKRAILDAANDFMKNESYDISLTDVQKMASVAGDIRGIVPLIETDYDDNKRHYDVMISSLQTSGGTPSSCKDISQFMFMLSKDKAVPSSISKKAGKIYDKMKNSTTTVIGSKSRYTTFMYVGAGFIGKDEYEKSCDEYGEVYDKNRFYSKSGWNSLFSVMQ